MIKHLPLSIANRLSSISCDAEAFNDAKPEYESALSSSGFNDMLEYTPPANEPTNTHVAPGPERKKRSRNIIWCNPPFNLSLKTKFAREVLKLIDTHFHRRHRYRRIFNRNTIKVSYSCTKNMAAIVSAHNAKVLAPPPPPPSAKTCNCRSGDTCPLDGQCLTSSIVYKATVTSPSQPVRYYYGLSEPPFKQRYNKHTHSFRWSEQRGETALSQYIWSLKDQDEQYSIKWSIHAKAHPYRCGQKRCDLCLSEKLAILRADPDTALNKRTEIATACRHRPKYRYSNVRDNG